MERSLSIVPEGDGSKPKSEMREMLQYGEGMVTESIEIWKDIPGYTGYQASSFGRIRSLGSRARIMKQFKNKNWDYLYLRFSPYNKTFTVHRLIAITFLPNIDSTLEVNHINGCGVDNRVENLEWVTAKENILHSYRIGRKACFGNARLTPDDVFEIRYLRYVGASIRLIAQEFNVHISLIYDIIIGKKWSSI